MRTRTMWLACLLAAGLALPSAGRAQEAAIPRAGTDAEVEAPRDWWVDFDLSFSKIHPQSLDLLGQEPAVRDEGPPPSEPLPGHQLGYSLARGQGYAPPDPDLPLPIGSTHPEAGFFVAGEAVLWRQTNPLRSQPIAYRGFIDVDGSITGFPNTRVGTFTPALNVKDAGGPGTYAPGFKWIAGWRFEDGSTIEASWLATLRYTYSAAANLIPPNFAVGSRLEETFLTAPVFNFPSLFSGPASKVNGGNPFAAYGIWNAASQMQIFFTQWMQIYEMKYRQTIIEDECWRMTGWVGPREVWFWERFQWRTVDIDASTGTSSSLDVAIYNNIVSQHLWGAFAGIGNEYWLGNGFATSLDVSVAGYFDYVKERASYELGEKFTPRAKRQIINWTEVPEVEAQFNVFWYPIEGVEVKLGYNAMAFFNTIAANDPIDFNFGSLTPAWQKGQFRLVDGVTVGVSIHF